jgi:hypothetical protein
MTLLEIAAALKAHIFQGDSVYLVCEPLPTTVYERYQITDSSAKGEVLLLTLKPASAVEQAK